MAVLYVKEQGASIRKRSESIVVSKGTDTLLQMPVANLENIAVIGNVQMTSQVLYTLMEQGVDVDYFTRSGKYLGCTAAEVSRNVFLRLAQYDVDHDLERRLELARRIVDNKVSNQIAIIQGYPFRDTYPWRMDTEKMEG